MGSIVFILLLIAMMMIVSTLVLGGWLVVTIMRVVFSGLSALAGAACGGAGPRGRGMCGPEGRSLGGAPPAVAGFGAVTCMNAYCRNGNPPGASFCRRCGQRLPARQHVVVRRAAMW